MKELMNMLDWHMPEAVQMQGRAQAKELSDITPFLQPCTPEHNKNVWDNCARILAERSDEELAPHIIPLLQWLQDMNWPGAFIVLARLTAFADTDALHAAMARCMAEAKKTHDAVWEQNLHLLETRERDKSE